MENDLKIEEYILASIKMEIKMFELYSAFEKIFTEDAEFWKELAIEERNHATLIRKIKPFLTFDKEMLNNYTTIEKDFAEIDILKIIEELKLNPNRFKAFEFAIQLENSASEIHYQTALVNSKNSKISDIFNELNGNDKDHFKRIVEYASKI